MSLHLDLAALKIKLHELEKAVVKAEASVGLSQAKLSVVRTLLDQFHAGAAAAIDKHGVSVGLADDQVTTLSGGEDKPPVP